MNKYIKSLIITILCGLLFSCGFKPLNQKNVGLINLQNITIEGDQRTAYILKNNLSLISNKESKNIYDAKIIITKNKSNKIKDKSGKTTRYGLTLSVQLELVDEINSKELRNTFTRSSDYDVATIHSDTINNENNATRNIIENITSDMNTFITLRMRGQ